MEVSPDGLLIVELVNDLPSLLDGLDDELDLVVEVVDLLDLDLYQFIPQNLLTALGVAADAFSQLG